MKARSVGTLVGVNAGATLPPLSNATSVLFQGTDDTVEIDGSGFGGTPDLEVNLGSNELSVECWFKATSAAQGYLIAHAQPFVPDIHVVLGFHDEGRLFGYFGAVGKNTTGVNGSVSLNTWYHAMWTVRNIGGTYTGNIWLNGVKQGSDVTSPGSDVCVNIPFRFGAGYVADSPNTAIPFIGHIDEVAIWSVGFTQAQVQARYNGGTPADPTLHSQAANLDYWYRMGDGDTFPTILNQITNADAECKNMAGSGTNFTSDVP